MARKTPEERLMAKVDQMGDCWLMKVGIDPDGYAKFWFDGKKRQAHRASYEIFIGPIPDGLTIDHICHTRVIDQCTSAPDCMHRRCVNPAHLEAVTKGVNTLRGNSIQARNASKTACPRGHEFTPENTYVDRRGCRQCRTCRQAYQREYMPSYRARKRAA